MLRSRINWLASRVALFAIIFASFAPTISHAFVVKTATSLQQEICGAHGARRVVHVDFIAEKKSDLAHDKTPIHLEHCSYCASHMGHVTAPRAQILVFLSEINSVAHIGVYAAPYVQAYYPVSHPSHAPPLV